MFCGSSSFHHGAGDDDWSAPATPKASTKKKLSSSSSSKNPYSSRGLDKFSSVLSELEARREKIMATATAKGPAMVRFKHSNSSSHDWIPIVVRLPPEETTAPASPKKPAPTQPKPKDPSPAQPQPQPQPQQRKSTVTWSAAKSAVTRKPSDDRIPAAGPSSYSTLLVVVLILGSLVMSGRVFAICCTSIWWYLLPALKGDESRNSRKRSSMKKEYVRRQSDKMLLSAAGDAAVSPSTRSRKQELASPRGNLHSAKR